MTHRHYLVQGNVHATLISESLIGILKKRQVKVNIALILETKKLQSSGSTAVKLRNKPVITRLNIPGTNRSSGCISIISVKYSDFGSKWKNCPEA